MLELGAFTVNKKCSEIWFCQGLSTKEKAQAALAVCAGLEALGGIPCCPETDYYLSGFAAAMARRLRETGEEDKAAEKLDRIGQDARKRFLEYSETDPVAKEVLSYDFLDFL